MCIFAKKKFKQDHLQEIEKVQVTAAMFCLLGA